MMKALVSNIFENHAILALSSRIVGGSPASSNDGTYSIVKKDAHCVLPVSQSRLHNQQYSSQRLTALWPDEPWSLWFSGKLDSDWNNWSIRSIVPNSPSIDWDYSRPHEVDTWKFNNKKKKRRRLRQ